MMNHTAAEGLLSCQSGSNIETLSSFTDIDRRPDGYCSCCVLQWAKLDHTLYRKRVSSFTFSECPISMSRRSQATVQPSDMLLLMDAMTGQNVQCLDKLGGFESF